jgi:hypothetical protein
VLGSLEPLSQLERGDLFACEEVIGGGWQAFVQVGLAFARIRDLRLYREQFDSFEAYCRDKWQYGRRYVNRLISAAQVFTHLGTISSLPKPEHETQVRPRVGLTVDPAQQAWKWAVEKAGNSVPCCPDRVLDPRGRCPGGPNRHNERGHGQRLLVLQRRFQ